MPQADCIFCKIIAGEVPSKTVYQDEQVVAFRDINPAAPVHILIVPRAHIQDNNAFSEEHAPIAGAMFLAVKKIAEQEGLAADGYRLIMNTGPNGHQEVPHMHLHLLGGGPMQHRMG